MNRPSFHFDIDYYVNRIVPRSRLHLLPKSISWFLGYREEPQQQVGNVLVWVWAFLGAFVGILVVEAVFQSDLLAAHGTPVIIASFVGSPNPCFEVHYSKNFQGSSSNPRIPHHRFTFSTTSKCYTRSGLCSLNWCECHEAFSTQFKF